MSQVKPDCYCLGGNRAHYSEAKYQSLQRTYEQARDEAKHLYGECLMLADVLRDAFEVVKTIEGEDSDECDKLQGLRMSIEYALAAYDERRIDTANYALVLASALAGCSDTVTRSQIAVALDLCKYHGGVDTAKMGPMIYTVRCSDNTVFVADAVANHTVPVSSQ